MQAFEDKAVCSRMSHSWHVGYTSTLYNPGVIMTSYSVQFIPPLTHVHSTQELFNQVSKFFRNFPLTSRHTGSENCLHATKLFEVQVHFVFGSSNQTSPGSLVFLWLSRQEKPIGRGRTTDVHSTCIGPVHENVEKTRSFRILLIWRVFPWESMHFGAKAEKDNRQRAQGNRTLTDRERRLKAGWFALTLEGLTLETLAATLSLDDGNLTLIKLDL